MNTRICTDEELSDMALDYGSLRDFLCKGFCEAIRIEQRPDGAWMVETPFQFPDGDHYPIRISYINQGWVRLSDQGHTLMHISYDHDIDLLMDGMRGMLLKHIMSESNLQLSDQEGFYLDVAIEKLHEAIFNFGQALTRIYDLTMISAER